jgi:hypothetical protein
MYNCIKHHRYIAHQCKMTCIYKATTVSSHPTQPHSHTQQSVDFNWVDGVMSKQLTTPQPAEVQAACLDLVPPQVELLEGVAAFQQVPKSHGSLVAQAVVAQV